MVDAPHALYSTSVCVCDATVPACRLQTKDTCGYPAAAAGKTSRQTNDHGEGQRDSQTALTTTIDAAAAATAGPRDFDWLAGRNSVIALSFLRRVYRPTWRWRVWRLAARRMLAAAAGERMRPRFPGPKSCCKTLPRPSTPGRAFLARAFAAILPTIFFSTTGFRGIERRDLLPESKAMLLLVAGRWRIKRTFFRRTNRTGERGGKGNCVFNMYIFNKRLIIC